MTNRFRGIPSIHSLLEQEIIQGLITDFSHGAVVDLIRSEMEIIRSSNVLDTSAFDLTQFLSKVKDEAHRLWANSPRQVINATGVVLHTNLGRAPLSQHSLKAVENASASYSNLEFDLDSGVRGSRQTGISGLLSLVTGAESALVVNNSAAAVMLGLATLANNKEVIVSRGEAVEIGGGFRIPEVLAQSGAKLVEVGTTNRTYATEYEAAIGDETGAILKVHSSNFRITGFTHSASLSELSHLGRWKDLPVLHDLGSGCLLETTQFGLTKEPTVQESVSSGCDLTFFSGDKLLGGPQAGIIVGKQHLIEQLSKHPIARAIRIDKLSIAALTATILHYLRNEAIEQIPIWKMISQSESDVRRRASILQSEIPNCSSIVEGESTIGGGSLPGETLPTWLVAIDGNAEKLSSLLRKSDPPIVTRIENGKVVIDLRTVTDAEEPILKKCLVSALKEN